MDPELFHVTIRIHDKNYKTLMDSTAIGDISARGIESDYVQELKRQKAFSDAVGQFSRPVDIAVHGRASPDEYETVEKV